MRGTKIGLNSMSLLPTPNLSIVNLRDLEHVQLANALDAVLTAANLQELNGQKYMDSSKLIDPEQLRVLAPLIAEWARLYDTTRKRSQRVVEDDSVSFDETDSFEHIPYEHRHDETL